MERLSGKEVNSVVAYIGVSGGYLGKFSSASHAEFYPAYCGLEIDPNEFNGTTRERFIAILSQANPLVQSKIMQGVIDKYPLDHFEDRFTDGHLTEGEFKQKQRITYSTRFNVQLPICTRDIRPLSDIDFGT